MRCYTALTDTQKRPRRGGNLPEPGQPTKEAAVNNFTAPSTHPAPECFACYEGVVYIGHLVEGEDGEEAEVI